MHIKYLACTFFTLNYCNKKIHVNIIQIFQNGMLARIYLITLKSLLMNASCSPCLLLLTHSSAVTPLWAIHSETNSQTLLWYVLGVCDQHPRYRGRKDLGGEPRQDGHPCRGICSTVHSRWEVPWPTLLCGSYQVHQDPAAHPWCHGGWHGREAGPEWRWQRVSISI